MTTVKISDETNELVEELQDEQKYSVTKKEIIAEAVQRLSEEGL